MVMGATGQLQLWWFIYNQMCNRSRYVCWTKGAVVINYTFSIYVSRFSSAHIFRLYLIGYDKDSAV